MARQTRSSLTALRSRTILSLMLLLFTAQSAAFAQREDSVALKVSAPGVQIGTVHHKLTGDGVMTLSVQDHSGKQITGLTKENFTILKKRKQALLSSVIPMTEVQDTRMRVMLLIDNSASMAPYVKSVISILDTLAASLGKGVLVSAPSSGRTRRRSSTRPHA